MNNKEYLLMKTYDTTEDSRQVSELSIDQVEEIDDVMSKQKNAHMFCILGFCCPLFWLLNHFMYLSVKDVIVQKYVRYSFWLIICWIPLTIFVVVLVIVVVLLVYTLV